jgi:hypothetical protein
MQTRYRLLILFVVGAILVLGSWWQFGGHETPQGQQPLVTIDAAALEGLKRAFNEAADKTRVIVILSPT